MKMFVFVIKDRATDQFGTPQFAMAPGQMVRNFGDLINEPGKENQFYQHPDDFDLYECGVFDTESGMFDCHVPRVLSRGKDLTVKEVN